MDIFMLYIIPQINFFFCETKHLKVNDCLKA
jgi:hypothetical protein